MYAVDDTAANDFTRLLAHCMIQSFPRDMAFALMQFLGSSTPARHSNSQDAIQLKLTDAGKKTLLTLVTPALYLALASPAVAADGAYSAGWNLVMIAIVAAATVASAALPVSALKHWTGYWKLVVAIPLLVLAAWSGWIVIARLLSTTAHPYWLLEIFAWSMLALLYMATAMTAKRQFEKADNPDGA